MPVPTRYRGFGLDPNVVKYAQLHGERRGHVAANCPYALASVVVQARISQCQAHRDKEIGVAAGYKSERLAGINTKEDAWRSFVGGTTPREFLTYAREENPRHAVSAYVDDLPAALGHDYNNEERAAIRGLLLGYIRAAGRDRLRGR